MKTKTLLITFAALAIPTMTQAEEGKKKCTDCSDRRAAIIKQFDTDGDGKLNEEERAAAKEARSAKMAEKKAEILAKYDTDGDGKISKEERQAAKDAFIEKYDTDGDGKLSKEERQVAKDAGERFPRHGKKCRKGHGKKRGGNQADAQ